MRVPILLAVLTLLSACVSTDPVTRALQSATLGAPLPGAEAADPEYGYTPEKPIKVGGVTEGPARERAFLAELRGPEGETVRFERLGSCCPFPSRNGIMGSGLLDIYLVWTGSSTEPKTLYLNMYEYEAPMVPLGFTKSGG